jgi:CheY-like chemotaxis protein
VGPISLLHVEDDPNDRLIMSILFRKVAPDLELKAATDGVEAVEALSKAPRPALVLLDLKLPKKNGFEVLEWARSRPELDALPILVLTSSSERGDIDRAYELGASSYLVKSVDMAAMREIARGVAQLARLREPAA